MESAALVAPLTHHPFVSKSQAPSGWNLLQQVAPLTHLAPVTHHRTVVGTCHWWVTGRRPNSLEYQICTAPEPFDTLVTGLPPPSLLAPCRALPSPPCQSPLSRRLCTAQFSKTPHFTPDPEYSQLTTPIFQTPLSPCAPELIQLDPVSSSPRRISL